jgi:ribosome-binding factor A
MLLRTLFRESASKISVTEVSVSPDLQNAYLYFAVMGTEKDIKEAEKFLLKNSKILRQKLFQRIKLRSSPRLNFKYDDSMSRGQHILQILDDLGNLQ